MLIGDEPYAPYQRPPLSKEFLSGAEDADSLWILRPSWIADNDVEIITGTSVTRVDTASGTVEFAGGSSIAADAVLFATGGSPRTLAVPGPRPDLVHYLRTLDDSIRLAPLLTPGRRLAVIGAGFIGLEIAATATAAGAAVTVIEAATVPLSRAIGADMGALMTRLHRDNGVDVRLGTAVAGIRTTADSVIIETGFGAEVLEVDAVIVGIGITPNVAAAAASGLAVDDGIVVDASGRTAVANVYAAGDVARRYSPRAGRHIRVEHFDNASRQGVAVADAMLGRDVVSDDPHWFWSDQFDRNMQFVGAAHGEPVIRGDRDAMDLTGFYFDDGVLCGAFTVDRGEDIAAVRELLGRELDPAALCDEDTDLFDLAYGDEDTETQVHA